MEKDIKKKRQPQKNVSVRDAIFAQLHEYCQLWNLKHSEFLEIALHTFLHIHGNPKDISKNIVKDGQLQDKTAQELLKTMQKSNLLQKKIVAMLETATPGKEAVAEDGEKSHSQENDDTERLLEKLAQGDTLSAAETYRLIDHGHCPKCGRRLENGSYVNKTTGSTITLIQCPEWKTCGFQIRGIEGTIFETITDK